MSITQHKIIGTDTDTISAFLSFGGFACNHAFACQTTCFIGIQIHTFAIAINSIWSAKTLSISAFAIADAFFSSRVFTGCTTCQIRQWIDADISNAAIFRYRLARNCAIATFIDTAFAIHAYAFTWLVTSATVLFIMKHLGAFFTS
jgi:hypothetical protein